MSADLKVVIKTHCLNGFDFECYLCGELYEQNRVAAMLLWNAGWDGPPDWTHVGDICLTCLDAGPDGASNNALDQVQGIRAHAEWLERLAKDIPLITEWPSSADIQRAEKEDEAAMLALDKASAN